MRIGEAIKLDRSDVDWARGVLLIRESKFGKSRLVPLHPSSMQALEATPGCAISSSRGPPNRPSWCPSTESACSTRSCS
jgi:integrase